MKITIECDEELEINITGDNCENGYVDLLIREEGGGPMVGSVTVHPKDLIKALTAFL